MVREGFRRDINGLRAWAVAAVVLYHFGLPGFGGGFVGVDVFFVISGYLMTGIVLGALEEGRFSLAGFYLARARRIVPALLGVCAVLLVLGWFFLLAGEYQTLATHAIASLLFLSNVKYWHEAGYFDLASHDKWLLHTWSLSVEWQFYLLLPMLMLAAWKLGRGHRGPAAAMLVGLLASLAASLLTSTSMPTAAFFGLHTRAWELLAGGLLVFVHLPSSMSQQGRKWFVELPGMLLVLTAIFAFDKHLSWPGWRAAIPVLGSLLILVARRENSVWTCKWPAQWLGDRSYSIYLWHWPVYVCLVYANLQHSAPALLGALFTTLLLGSLSYRWIEQASRRAMQHLRWPASSLALTTGTATLLLVGAMVRAEQGVAGRFSPDAEAAAAEANNRGLLRASCHATHGLTSPSCLHGGQKVGLVVLGDSHASALMSAVGAAMPAGMGALEFSYSACPFVRAMHHLPPLPSEDFRCGEFLAWAQQSINELPPSVPVMLVGRYALPAFGYNEEGELNPKPRVFFSEPYEHTTAEFLAEFAMHVTRDACELARTRPVYMLRPIPEMGFDVPSAVARRIAMGLSAEVSIPLSAYRSRNQWLWAAQDAARQQCGVKVLDPLPLLCQGERCMGSMNGRPLYVDDDHLSESGNKRLVPLFRTMFAGAAEGYAR